MKFSCLKENIERALLITERFTGKNVTLPILGNVLLENGGSFLSVTATNLEYAVQLTVPGNGSRPGKVSVPAKIFSSLLQSIKEDRLDLEEKQGALIIKAGGRDIRINGMQADDFPLVPKIKKTDFFCIEGDALRFSLEKVLPAVSPSEFKPELSGVYFRTSGRTLRLAATDTFRLAEGTSGLTGKSEGENLSFILPHRMCQEVSRIFQGEEEVKVFLAENQVLFETKDTRALSRVIEGNFPEYTAIIPKSFETSCILERSELIDAIRASSIFASKLQEVKFRFHGRELEVEAINPEVGEYKTKIPASISGKDVTIGFNHRYLLDGVNALEEEKVFLGINSENSPSLLRDNDGGAFLYVVMPIRLT